MYISIDICRDIYIAIDTDLSTYRYIDKQI